MVHTGAVDFYRHLLVDLPVAAVPDQQAVLHFLLLRISLVKGADWLRLALEK